MVADLTRYRWSAAGTDVAFLYGALGADALTGPVLVSMLRGLGRSESAARNVLVRMRDMGQIESRSHGRVNVYRLSEATRPKYRDIEGTAVPQPWSGDFHSLVYHVPESRRLLRDRLQHVALSAGYGQLRAGVLITTSDRWARLHLNEEEFGPDAWIFRSTMTPEGIDAAREMARRAWDLGGLRALYDDALRACSQVPGTVGGDWQSLLRWRELYTVFLAAQVRDPYLPAELLPTDWPQRRFLLAQAEVNARIGNTVQPFLRAVAAELDASGLCEYYRSPWAVQG